MAVETADDIYAQPKKKKNKGKTKSGGRAYDNQAFDAATPALYENCVIEQVYENTAFPTKRKVGLVYADKMTGSFYLVQYAHVI